MESPGIIEKALSNNYLYNKTLKKSVIITAGGTGSRMGSTFPKQFMILGDKPLLMHTMASFSMSDILLEIVVTLPEEHIKLWEGLCKRHRFPIEHRTVAGGATRGESVRNGLKIASGELIAVHDGVRPFVDVNVIKACFVSAEKFGSGVPVIPVEQSLRRMIGDKSEVRNRDDFRLVQTPQVFKADILRTAYASKTIESFTDDASLVQSAGFDVHLVEGNRENIKITTPFDLEIASLLVEKIKSA